MLVNLTYSRGFFCIQGIIKKITIIQETSKQKWNSLVQPCCPGWIGGGVGPGLSPRPGMGLGPRGVRF